MRQSPCKNCSWTFSKWSQFTRSFCALVVLQFIFCHFSELQLSFLLFAHFPLEPHFCKANITKHNSKQFVNVLKAIGIYKLNIEWITTRLQPLVLRAVLIWIGQIFWWQRDTLNQQGGSVLHYHVCRCLTTTASETSGLSRIAAVIRSDLTLARCITSNNNSTLSQFQNIAARGLGSACETETSFPPEVSSSRDISEELRGSDDEINWLFQAFNTTLLWVNVRNTPENGRHRFP